MIKRLLLSILLICNLAFGQVYLGDIAEDSTIAFIWSSVDGDGASVTRATDGTIKVRRLDDGTDCTGTSVTDTEDTPDTGLHECKIDTSDSANFTTGDDYIVWLDGAVIDGTTVNAVLAQFSIEARYVNLDEIEGGDATDALDTAADTVTVTSIGNNVITSASIADGGITDADVANDVQVDVVTIETGDATTALDTAADTVTVTSIGNNVITSASIADGGITNADVADDVDIDVHTVEGTDATTYIEGRTLAAADYFLFGSDAVANVTTVGTVTNDVTTDSASRTASQADVSGLATSAALATAQTDLDTITGSDGVTLATTQSLYAPAKAGDAMTLANDAITLAKFDESTAFPLVASDAGATQVARVGADSDTLETLSDQIDGVGGGGDATEAKQDTIIASLTAAKGATFDTATDSLEAIRNRGDAAWIGALGTGLTAVNEDTGGTDNLAYKTGAGAGISGAIVRAYVATEYAASGSSATIRGETRTTDDGGWVDNLMLNEGTAYTIWFYKQGEYGPDTENVTP